MLKTILTSCRSIELAAETAYRRFSTHSDSNELTAFWQEMAQDEKRHVTYWEKLLALESQGDLQNPLDSPQKMLDELNAMQAQIDQFNGSADRLTAFSDLILWAYRIESYMLHPDFSDLSM